MSNRDRFVKVYDDMGMFPAELPIDNLRDLAFFREVLGIEYFEIEKDGDPGFVMVYKRDRLVAMYARLDIVLQSYQDVEMELELELCTIEAD